MEQLHHSQLHPAGLLRVPDGLAAQQQVQRLAGDGLPQGLFVLLRAQVGQQIRDHQPGVSLVGADIHLHGGAVPQRRDAMELQGDGDPLVFADAAVVMGLEVGQLPVLIQGIGLQVQPGGVDVGGGDLTPLRQRPLSDPGQQHALAPVGDVDLVTGGERRPPDIGAVTGGLSQPDGLRGAQPLGLSGIQKRLVGSAVCLHGCEFSVGEPVVAVLPGGEEPLLQLLELMLFHVLFPP